MNASDGVFIDMQIIGQPLNADGDIDGIHMPAGMTHLIKVGSAETVRSAYYNSVNITDNVTNGGNDATVFINDNDVVYIGANNNFTTVSIALSTGSSGDVTLTYSYCDGAGVWQTLPGVSDSTSGFRISGTILFPNPSDRGKCNQEIDGTPFSDTKDYAYIALTRTRNNILTPPVIDTINIAGGSTSMFLTDDTLRLNPVETAPETCGATNLGAIYFDISEDDMCICKLGGWEVIRDGSACT